MEGPMASVPRMKKFVVEGVYRSDIPEQELHTIFAPDQSVRAFLRKADVLSSWEITVKNFESAPEIGAQVRKLLPQYRVQDWIEMNSHLFASLRLERIAMFVILAFIVIVASFNIVTTLTLMVLEKKKEISILKAMGAKDAEIGAVFLTEGLTIGGIGIGGGLLLGLVLCSLLKRYDFIQLPDIYYDRTLPVAFDLRYYILVSICAFVIVVTACLYPSRRAAQVDPLEGIRFN
jgi:lipoprotein-releasing system permease protein